MKTEKYQNNNYISRKDLLMLEGHTVNIKEYLTLIKVNWKPVSIIIFSILVISVIYAIESPDVYRSTTILKVSNPKGNILETAFSPDFRDAKSSFIQNEIEILNSFSIKEKVAKALIDSLKGNKYPQFYMVFDYNKTDRKWEVLPIFEIVDKIDSKVNIEQKSALDVLNISAESTSAYEAALLANIYSAIYHNTNMTISRTHMINIRKFLEKQKNEKYKMLIDAENTLRNYKERNGVTALDEQSTALIRQFTDFEAKENAAKIELKMAEGILSDYKAELSRQLPHINDYMEKYAIEPYLEELQKGIAQYELKRDLVFYTGTNSKNSEIINSYNEKINELKEKRDKKLEVFKTGLMASSSSEIKQLLQKVLEAEVKYHGTLASYNELNLIVNKYNGIFNALPKKTIDLARLEREKGELEKLYLLLTEKYQEAIINEESTPDNVLIVDAGRISSIPVKPNRLLIIIIGFIIGAVFSHLYISVKRCFNNKINTPEEIQKLELNLIGWIPKIPDISGSRTESEFIVYNKPYSIPSEAYKTIRTRIQYAKMNHNTIKTILVTTAMPNEGKTVTAINLAGSFAQAGRKTVVIDCDLRRPRIHKVFNKNKVPGISDYLLGDVFYEEILRKCEQPNLLFCPSGSKVNNPAEILGSSKFNEFLKKLEKEFDIIIIDSTPVLAVTDAEVLSYMVDVSILVVAAHSTEIEVIKKAAEILEKDQNAKLEVLLNKFVYKSGYGSYYRNYSYNDEQPKKENI